MVPSFAMHRRTWMTLLLAVSLLRTGGAGLTLQEQVAVLRN